tara:strand:+ start:54 stop:203 length:150 start_codon:yes stop_codon:yes gene_type:complete
MEKKNTKRNMIGINLLLTMKEIIEEEIEETEFFIQENKNNLTYNLEYCT